MNQTTINITARQDLAQVSLRKKVGEMVQGVNKWLDAKSGFYGSPDKPEGLSIQLCKSEKKEFYIRYSS